MKKVLFGSVAMLLTVSVFAQPGQHPDGPPPPPPVAERWRHDSTKLQLYVVLSANEINGTKAAFLSFYNDMDGLRQQNKPAPREELEKTRAKRNNALKEIFNPQQFDRFETFEREFMPLPPPPKGPQGPKENV